MEEHPIESLMVTAMNSIKDMVDVNTIVGDPINTINNTVIIPISKVSFGFASGGSEFNGETIEKYNKKNNEEDIEYKVPFGGGSGAGVSINPIAFLVVQSSGVKLLPLENYSGLDRLLDYVPEIIEKINSSINSCETKCKEACKNNIEDFEDIEDLINDSNVTKKVKKVIKNVRKKDY